MKKSMRYILASFLSLLLLLSIFICLRSDLRESLYWNLALRLDSKNKPLFLIIPKESLDGIRFGMTRKDVVHILGEPDKKNGGAYEYLHMGFAVFFNDSGRVQKFFCGSYCDSKSPLIDLFKGVTPEGIKMWSSKSEVTKAYGTGFEEKNVSATREILTYPPIGTSFVIDHNHVIHMAFE